MQTHSLVQGSDSWHQFRLEHFGASEAAAMLGLSKKVKRNELLNMKHTGNAKEFSDWVQANILDYGHEVEALARPIVEEMIGEDLYPVTCSDGRLSASCDGLTIGEDIAFEHKQWNESLAASVRACELPDEYMPQCQQIMMVTGAEKVIFVVSDGTPEKFVYMAVHPDPAWFDRIRAGWAQFEKDLAEYVPREIVEKPKADAILALPALVVQIRGEVANSNLPIFKASAEAFIAKINTDLKTDEDFAVAEATVKFCKEAEDNIALAKDAAIAQTASIDDLMRTLDHIQAQLRDKRLTLDKLVKSQKEVIKNGILSKAKLAFAEHVAALEAEIKPVRLIYGAPDFAGAMKNKRTLASLHDAVDSELANAKISTDAIAKDFRAKLAWCKANAEGYGFLFMDMQQIIVKAEDDFQLVVKTRIAEHKKAEADKMESERAKIAAEEKAKAEAKARADQEDEDALIASFHEAARRIEFDSVPYIEKASRQYESTGGNWENDTRPRVAAAFLAGRAYLKERLEVAKKRAELGASSRSQVVPEAVQQCQKPGTPEEKREQPETAARAPSSPPTLRLGQIGERLGFVVTADFLTSIGFAPAATDKSAKLYHESDFPRICQSIAQHVVAVGNRFGVREAA